MLPEEAARLEEVDEPYAEEPRTVEVPGRVAAAEARAAVETAREAAGTVRVAEEAERLTVGAEPAAEGVSLEGKNLTWVETDGVYSYACSVVIHPLDAEHPTMARANRFQYYVKDALKDSKYSKKDKDLRLFEVLDKIKSYDSAIEKAQGSSKIKGTERYFLKRERSELCVEFSKRFVFAMASFCFVLVGIPLGIKAQRKESSIGMAIALAVSLGYYLIAILMLSLHKNFAIHPELLIWLAVAASLVLAGRLIPKNL